MSSKSTTLIGVLLGLLTVIFGTLQPYLDAGGAIDWKIVLPAVVIAIVHYLEKQNGSWKTTFVYSLIAAIGAGASTFIANPTWSWVAILAAALLPLAGYFTKDHTAVDPGTGSAGANSSPPNSEAMGGLN